MSFRVYTIKHTRGGREKVQNVFTVKTSDQVERRLGRAVTAGQEAWAENEAGERVGTVERNVLGELALTIDREKLRR